MKTRIYAIIWLTCILCSTVTNSQELPQAIKSPNAANLGKFGDLPVSYSTGAVDISIPFHELSGNGINLPITLRYDASGIRVNSLPSWVGQNWTLDAGGVITRTAQGYPDEYKYITTEYLKFSNYFSSYSHLPNIYEDNRKLRDSVQHKDFEPDIFNFTFMGKSGKFFLGNDGEWKVM
ncbi:hypothetical protein LJC72_13540 [Bacteroides sp. OttesenSCG-928-D19]|nr:hypothetical protein [Bacteroides sp. OttesenSCG-928-D19]